MKIQNIIRSSLVIIILLLLQTTFLPLISLGGFAPDVFILFLVYTALKRGQIETTIYGFTAGLLQDIVAIKFLGLAALSKTIAGFTIGYFFNENTTERTLGSYRYILLVGLCSIVHNLVYFTVFFQGNEGSMMQSVIKSTSGTSLYTCVIGILPMFYFARKFKISWTQ